MEKCQIQNIVVKYFTSELSSGEDKILKQWISQSGENHRTFNIYESLWIKSQNMILPSPIDLKVSLCRVKKEIKGK